MTNAYHKELLALSQGFCGLCETFFRFLEIHPNVGVVQEALLWKLRSRKWLRFSGLSLGALFRQIRKTPRVIFSDLKNWQSFSNKVLVIRGFSYLFTVYEDGSNFIILDGERRWRCATLLGLANVPVIVQPKPSGSEHQDDVRNPQHAP